MTLTMNRALGIAGVALAAILVLSPLVARAEGNYDVNKSSNTTVNTSTGTATSRINLNNSPAFQQLKEVNQSSQAAAKEPSLEKAKEKSNENIDTRKKDK